MLFVEGSTGGAGLRGLQGEDPHPLTATVLYFDEETLRLVAYDRITIKGFGETGATIDRQIIDPEDDGEARDQDADDGQDPPSDDGAASDG
jgi:hypothetical protein